VNPLKLVGARCAAKDCFSTKIILFATRSLKQIAFAIIMSSLRDWWHVMGRESLKMVGARCAAKDYFFHEDYFPRRAVTKTNCVRYNNVIPSGLVLRNVIEYSAFQS